jgi:hypothetical protein
MSAATYNITIEQGATFSKILTVKGLNDTPLDLTTLNEVRAQLRYRAQADEKWDFAVTILNTQNGTIKWSMLPSVTNTIERSKGVYDMELVWNDGRIERILQGDVNIKSNITREE